MSVLVEEVRSRIANVRGTLSDISAAYPGWRQQVENVEGLLTCGLVALYGAKEEMLESERRLRECERVARERGAAEA